MPDKFIDKYKISSNRLTGWNYSNPGVYFITICTYLHNKFFGKIIDNQMVLSDCGKICNQYLFDIPNHFSDIRLVDFVVMPNHVHLLVHVETRHGASLSNNKSNDILFNKNDNIISQNSHKTSPINIETRHGASLQCNRKVTLINFSYKNHPNYFLRLTKKSNQLIPNVINQFKSSVTRQCKIKNLFFGWQSRYYDEIIQSKKRFFQIKNYIKNNPKNWLLDKMYDPS